MLMQAFRNTVIFLWKRLDWLRTFWPIPQEQTSSQIWDLCRNTANNINLHYRTDAVKINDQIIQCIQKTLFLDHFWSIFPIRKYFSRKSGSVTHFHIGF